MNPQIQYLTTLSPVDPKKKFIKAFSRDDLTAINLINGKVFINDQSPISESSCLAPCLTGFTSVHQLRYISQWCMHILLCKRQIDHTSFQILLICWQVKMAMSTHCHKNHFWFSSFSTMESFPNGGSYGMSWLRCWYQPFRPCKFYGSCNNVKLKSSSFLRCNSLFQTLVNYSTGCHKEICGHWLPISGLERKRDVRNIPWKHSIWGIAIASMKPNS